MATFRKRSGAVLPNESLPGLSTHFPITTSTHGSLSCDADRLQSWEATTYMPALRHYPLLDMGCKSYPILSSWAWAASLSKARRRACLVSCVLAADSAAAGWLDANPFNEIQATVPSLIGHLEHLHPGAPIKKRPTWYIGRFTRIRCQPVSGLGTVIVIRSENAPQSVACVVPFR